MAKQIFLTGSTGFLGSYLCHTLLQEGHRVVALARPSKTATSRERVVETLRHVPPSPEDIENWTVRSSMRGLLELYGKCYRDPIFRPIVERGNLQRPRVSLTPVAAAAVLSSNVFEDAMRQARQSLRVWGIPASERRPSLCPELTSRVQLHPEYGSS